MKSIKDLQQIGIIKGTRVLAVFAHPDDETVFSAGFLNKAVKVGANVRLLCLTRGEKSTLRFGLKDNDRLDEVRKKELQGVLKILGIQTSEIHDIPDGEIEQRSEEVEEILEKEFADFRPEFILTLEPYGISGHPDHIALTRNITDLFYKPGNNFELVYATVTDDYKPSAGSKKMVKQSNKIPPIKPDFSLRLNYGQMIRKLKSFRCHKSQFRTNLEFIRKWQKRKLLTKEHFKILSK